MPRHVSQAGAAIHVLSRIARANLMAGAKTPLSFELRTFGIERSLVLELQETCSRIADLLNEVLYRAREQSAVSFMPATGSCSTMASVVRIRSGCRSGFPICNPGNE